MTATELEFIYKIGTKNDQEIVHAFLLEHFRVTEPITTSLGCTKEDVHQFFTDLARNGLENERYSTLVFDKPIYGKSTVIVARPSMKTALDRIFGRTPVKFVRVSQRRDELVAVCLNDMKQNAYELDEKLSEFNPYQDYGEDIENGPYENENANKICLFVETMEQDLPALTSFSEKIFKLDVLCVSKKCQGKGIGRILFEKSRKIAEDNGCQFLATVATAKASQAIFTKAGLKTLRELPFSCFRNHGQIVFQNLPDGGVSGKLMGIRLETSAANNARHNQEDEDEDLR